MVLVVASAVGAKSVHQMRSMVRQEQLKVKAGCPRRVCRFNCAAADAAYLKCIEKAWNKKKTSCRTNDECSKRCLNVKNELKDAHCILIPGGFGERGVKGKITSINYARKQNIPFFGINYGTEFFEISWLWQ